MRRTIGEVQVAAVGVGEEPSGGVLQEAARWPLRGLMYDRLLDGLWSGPVTRRAGCG
jgi:hypothetical protein